MAGPQPGDRGELAALEAEVAALKQALAGREAKVAEKVAELAEAGSLHGLAAVLRLVEAQREAEKNREDVAEAEERLTHQRARLDPAWRDLAGLPEHLLMKVAGKLVAQTEAGWAARLKEVLGRSEEYLKESPRYWTEEKIQMEMAWRKGNGNCLYVFARVCKKWRKAQLKVGGRLRTRVKSDVIAPGSVALAKWAPAEGCPRDDGAGFTMAEVAARYGHLELMQWLCGEGGFVMFAIVMRCAAGSGNLELVQWLRGEGCPWDWWTCAMAVDNGHVEVLRWVRENGCEWDAEIRDRAAEELGYTDDFGNLEELDDEYGYEDSDEFWDDE